MPEIIFNQKEDIMLPEPTLEQTTLWEEIESSLNEEAIETEADFVALPDETRAYFTSPEITEKIIDLAKKHQLGAEQTKRLSNLIKKTAVKKINLTELENYLVKELSLTTDKAKELSRDILNEIFGPIREKLNLGRREGSSPARPMPPSMGPAEPRIEGNIVDLKRE